MRIVLCHNCWSWVPLDSDPCPECHRAIDLNEPDPTAAQLDERFGVAHWRLGTVRCERKQLPSVGQLIGTTAGLIFLPDLNALPNGAVQPVERRAERFWQRPAWWSLWGRQAPAVPQLHESFVELGNLGERFLSAPGALFVPREQLIRAALCGRSWTISRTVGSTLRFTALSTADEARQAWREMLNRDPAWRELAASGR
jgi:hypothetical protein